MINIAFADVETTHLSAEIGEAWEVAVILREFEDDQHMDTEYVWEFSIDPETVDPEALAVGRWHDRHQLPARTTAAAFTGTIPAVIMSRAEAVEAITRVLSGAVLVGSNPAFDDRFLRKLVGPGNAQWHYRPYDIVQLAAAKIGAQQAGPLPWPTHAMSRAVGVEPPSKDAAHTALGDARWARDVHDAAMVKEKIPLTWEGRAQHAIGLYTRTAVELEDARRDLARQAQEMATWRATANTLDAGAPGTPRDRAEHAEASIERAEKLASQWSVLRAYGGAATELRAVLGGKEPQQLPEGFRTDTLVAAQCTVCEDTFDEEESHTVFFKTVDEAHQVLRGYGWTILADGRAVCDHEDDEHQALRDDAPSQPVNAGQGTLDDSDADGQEDDEPEETGNSDADVLDLIAEIAGHLTDATDGNEYHAVGLIADLANGRTTVADARTELATLTFRHV
ncbi:hypothetical protein ACGFZS_09705 [Streptomyces sp. NPDC048288]|uniref:3'-5' exonuclease n=1 Tax=Streptomyces sp. NPDC048288 TaxID=3365529 RepID=UPI0037106860